MFQAVLFDMDGLMFDTERLGRDAWRQVGRELGLTISEQILRQIRGATPQASAEVFRAAFGPDFDYPAARARRLALAEKRIRAGGVPVKPGLTGLLRGLQARGVLCAVASSSPRATVERYLCLTGLTDSYAAVVGAEDITRSKPAPDSFLTAARALNVPPAACLVLEDSANGLRAARAAGMTAVCIPDLALPEPEALACAAAVLPGLDRVLPWMERH